MQNLNPTLWRTCRMLAGETRMKLLRSLYENPGQNVTQFAEAVGIGVSDASQELRRIQSRGLLEADHCHVALIYSFRADPQVTSAAPILKALLKALSMKTPRANEKICEIANGLGHIHRISILKLLMKSSQNAYSLQKELHLSYRSIGRHLQPLLGSGLIRHDKQKLHYVPPIHPLAKALVKLLPD